MDELQLQQIIEVVMRQVLASIQKESTEAAAEGKEKLLVIGNPGGLPEHLVRNAMICSLEDYEKARNIHRYQRVLIENLTLTQLVDISMGRVSDSVSCAVTQALLNGVEVWMLETALPHRMFAGKGSNSFYQMLEGYVQKLLVFGIKLLGDDKLCPKEEKPPVQAKFQAPTVPVPKRSMQPNADRLITESMAVKMVDQTKGEILLPVNTILTPSALDVFTQAKVKIRKEI